MWLGESVLSLDDKGRVVVPKRLQAGLDRDVEGRTSAIVTRGFEGCLFVFAESVFNALISKMKTQAFEGPQERKMQRLFFSSSERLWLDAQGRLLVPEKLRSLVGLEKDAVLVGLIDRIEIWPKKAWDAYQAHHGGDFDQLDSVLSAGADGGPVAHP